MKKRVRMVCIVLLIATLGGLAWIALPSNEPAYAGRPLSHWLRQRDDAATNAIRHIGSDALPTLLDLARAKDSALKKRLLRIKREHDIIPFHLESASEANTMACFGFCALGPLAKDAVPELVRLLGDSNTNLQVTAILSLGNIGSAAQEAVPALVPLINHTNILVRGAAKFTLGRIHAQPAVALPALIANLAVRDRNTHLTLRALAEFGSEAKAAVPAILNCLNDPNIHVRTSATNALKRIDPEAAAKAGIQ